jgi:hypothetical protein
MLQELIDALTMQENLADLDCDTIVTIMLLTAPCVVLAAAWHVAGAH